MRKLFFALACILTATFASASNDSLPVPDFVDEPMLLVHKDSALSLKPLDYEQAFLKTQASAAKFLIGYGAGEIRTRIELNGLTGKTCLTPGTVHIVYTPSNPQVNPKSQIELFTLQRAKKRRYAQIMTSKSFGGVETQDPTAVSYTITKYGDTSYMIEFHAMPGSDIAFRFKSDPYKLYTFTIVYQALQ